MDKEFPEMTQFFLDFSGNGSYPLDKDVVTVHQHLIFVHFDLLIRLRRTTQAQMNEPKALVNGYRPRMTEACHPW